MTNYAQVIATKYPSAEWSITANDYDSLIWLSDLPKPSQNELDAQWAEVQTKIESDKQAQATAKQALLDRLGITADEARLLLS